MEDNNTMIFNPDQAPLESDTVEETKVKFTRHWKFWENYESKTGKLDYAQSLKEIFTCEDTISFWQFWNNYPGANPSNIFYNGERLR